MSYSGFKCVSDSISVSNCQDVSLCGYVSNLPRYCSLIHKPSCTSCSALLSIAKSILENGFVLLAKASQSAFPNVTYHTENAKRRVLKMPLAALRVGCPKAGMSEIYLFEYSKGLNYHQFLCLLNAFHIEKTTEQLSMSKEQLKNVLSLAQSDREKEMIRYTAVLSSGLSATAARKHFGLDSVQHRVARVESALEEMRAIRLAFERIANIQESAALAQFGITCDSDSSPSGSDSDNDTSEDSAQPFTSTVSLSRDDIVSLLKAREWNWFEVVSAADDNRVDISLVESEYEHIVCDLSEPEVSLLRQSHTAFLEVSTTDDPIESRQAAAFNGDVVSESDSDNPDDFIDTDRAKAVLKKKIQAIRRKAQRDRAKLVAQRRFLGRRVSKKVRGILAAFPNIGKSIEDFVEERSVGADAWRRTGMLTFDGNSTVKEKVTYLRIKEHLEEVYKRKFSYGTVVQLCVARNRRRASAKRYKGVAKVTCRRARKGFQLRYNPDSHWSAALYRSLNFLQYTDGRHILNVNRDDAAGFSVDTLTTHRLHRTPVVRGKEILTTRTDYVNSYPSLLQTTSYNFSRTKTTGEVCVGVVKGAGIFQKNAAQHAADLEFLQSESSVNAIFINPLTEEHKRVECIRVDGATDEGPSHLEIQFWWTYRHIQRPTAVTLVTTRSSGASYLNRVELQNGCMALAHANLFIPSNLNGSCFDPETGKVDQERLKRNMDQATEIYISRCNHAPCGDTVIHLFKGADSSENQQLRDDVLVYIKGTVILKNALKQSKPDRWNLFEDVWDVRGRHMTLGLPTQYVFLLKCCGASDCSHPLCKQSIEIPPWFPGGPTFDYFPLPIPDPSSKWGTTECSKCGDKVCYGHFLTPELSLKSTATAMKKPPSERRIC